MCPNETVKSNFNFFRGPFLSMTKAKRNTLMLIISVYFCFYKERFFLKRNHHFDFQLSIYIDLPLSLPPNFLTIFSFSHPILQLCTFPTSNSRLLLLQSYLLGFRDQSQDHSIKVIEETQEIETQFEKAFLLVT